MNFLYYDMKSLRFFVPAILIFISIFISSVSYASTEEVQRSSSETNREWTMATYSSPEVERVITINQEPTVIIRDGEVYEETYYSSAPEPAPMPVVLEKTGLPLNIFIFLGFIFSLIGIQLIITRKNK